MDDGMVLVLCSEKPTLNDYGNRIDENGNALGEVGNRYYNILNQEVQVDEEKRVVHAFDLTLPVIPESLPTEVSGIIYVSWESILPTDKTNIQRLKGQRSDTPKRPAYLQGMENLDMLTRSYLKEYDGRSDILGYDDASMQHLCVTLSQALNRHMVVSVVPMCSENDPPAVVGERTSFIRTWQDIHNTLQSSKRVSPVDFKDIMMYKEFADVKRAAGKAFMEVLNKGGSEK